MIQSKENKELIAFKSSSISAFRSLISELKGYGSRARTKYKGSDKSVLNKRKKHILDQIIDLPQVKDFLDVWVGSEEVSDSTVKCRTSTINLLRDYLAGHSNLRKVCSDFESKCEKHFKAIELHKSQSDLKKRIPPEIRTFLPPTISVEIDKDGYIKKINDIFSNKTYTLAQKIKNQKKLLQNYNEIVKKVRADLESNDDFLRLSALITSIIMETGIRPGKKGNKTIKVVDGKKIEIETFGAVTLQRSHLKFLKDGFIELRFEGKKGSINTAYIKDEYLVGVLKDYIKNGLITGSDYLFVSGDGRHYTYRDLNRYFKQNFNGFKITDFRKLKATQEVFDGLNEEREAMLKKIKEVSKKQTENLEDRVIKVVVNTIQKAHDRAQVSLSHQSGKTTEKSYINPEVLLSFLSGCLKKNKTLEDCILSGKTKLQFDPMSFVRESKTASRSIYASGRRLDSFETLIDILDNLFTDGTITRQ